MDIRTDIINVDSRESSYPKENCNKETKQALDISVSRSINKSRIVKEGKL